MNKKYDKNNNLIYQTDSSNGEYWYKYNENNNLIYLKTSSGYECQKEYNKNKKYLELWKYPNKSENYYKIDNKRKKIEITKQEFENIKIKEYNSRTKCSRFELMDI